MLLNGILSGCSSVNSKLFKDEPVTLTLYNVEANGEMVTDYDVMKKIEEITGVKLKIIGNNEAFSKPIDLMIAKEDYPDLIYAKGDTGSLIDSRVLIKLDEYMEKYGDNLKALYGDQLIRLKHTAEDPSIYTVGSGNSDMPLNPEGTVQIQHAVLKELNYPRITTIKEYENAIKEYMSKYPEINGEKTIGMSLMASDWRWLITVGNIASAVAGIPNDGQFSVNDETGEVKYKFEIPEVKEYLKWLNHIYNEGLLDKDSFTQTQEEYHEKMRKGLILAISDSKWDYNVTNDNLVAAGKEELTFAPLSVTVNSTVKDQSLKNYGFSGGWGIGITKTCKNPEKAFKLLDWLASDEAQVLLNWGIEGKHYKYENGKRVFLDSLKEQMKTDSNFTYSSGINKYTNFLISRGDGEVDSTGNNYTTNTLENYIENYNSAEKATLAAYGAKSWVELFPTAEELGESKHGQVWEYNIPADSDISLIQNKADAFTQEAITKAIIGPEEEFDIAWDSIQAELKNLGVDKMNKDMTELTKEKIALWNK